MQLSALLLPANSLAMDFFSHFLCGGLHNGDAAMSEPVDELCPARAGYLRAV
jgi:hypothetical protein